MQPNYYKKYGLSPVDAFKQGLISRDEYIGFIKGNIIKYVVRAGHKDSAVEDLKKARNYIDFYLDLIDLTGPEFDLVPIKFKQYPLKIGNLDKDTRKEVEERLNEFLKNKVPYVQSPTVRIDTDDETD